MPSGGARLCRFQVPPPGVCSQRQVRQATESTVSGGPDGIGRDLRVNEDGLPQACGDGPDIFKSRIIHQDFADTAVDITPVSPSPTARPSSAAAAAGPASGSVAITLNRVGLSLTAAGTVSLASRLSATASAWLRPWVPGGASESTPWAWPRCCQ